MCTFLKSAALSGLIALGAISGLSSQAAADSIIVGDSDSRLELHIGRDDDRIYRDRERDRWDRHDRDRSAYRERCSPERALWKAERMGVRRARVVDVSRRTIVVRGRARGERVFVTFGRQPHCPVIGY